jgi:hypothetical protein
MLIGRRVNSEVNIRVLHTPFYQNFAYTPHFRISSHISRLFRTSDANSISSSAFLYGDTLSSSGSAFSNLGRALSIFEQSSDLSYFRPNADTSELPPIEIKGKKYIKKEWTHQKRKRSA